MKNILVLFFISLIPIFNHTYAQISPEEISSMFYDIDDYSSSYFSVVDEAIEEGNYIKKDNDPSFSTEDLENQKLSYLENLVSTSKEFKDYLTNFDGKISISLKNISKNSPYIPQQANNIIHVYNNSLTILNQIENKFDSISSKWNSIIETGFGIKIIPIMTTEQRNLLKVYESSELKLNLNGRLYDYDFEYIQDSYRYKNQIKFLKKYKIDSLIGHYSSESTNCYIGYNTKSGQCGLFEVDHQFNSKSTSVLLPIKYDSIDFDIRYGEYGNSNWSTAIGWQNGTATIIEKDYHDDEDVYSSYDIISYEFENRNISIPGKFHLVKGILQEKDEQGNYFYIDGNLDTLLTPKYTQINYLPLVWDGEIKTLNRVKLKNGKVRYGTTTHTKEEGEIYSIMYHSADLSVSYYSDSLEEASYFENGNIKWRKTYTNSDTSFYESHYESGQLESIGIYINGSRESNWINYWENGKIKRKSFFNQGYSSGLITDYYENGSIKSEITYDKSQKDGPYVTYYSNGNIHIKGTNKSFNSYSKLSGTYESFYFNGKPHIKKYYIENHKDSIAYIYNPLRQRTDLSDKGNSTKIIFPTRYFESKDSHYTILNDYDNIALVRGEISYSDGFKKWSYWDETSYYELWDTKNQRQLIPILQGSYYGYFIGESSIYNFMDDVPQVYNFNELSDPTIDDDTTNLTKYYILESSPIKIGNKGVILNSSSLVFYDWKNLHIHYELDLPENRELVLFQINNSGDAIHLIIDSLYMLVNLENYSVIKSKEIEYHSTPRYIINDQLICYNDEWKTIDSNYQKLIYDFEGIDLINFTLITNHSDTLFDCDETFYKNDNKLIFSTQNDTSTSLELVVIKNTFELIPTHFQPSPTTIFNPNKNIPKQKLFLGYLNYNSNTLDIADFDSTVYNLDLSAGIVNRDLNKFNSNTFLIDTTITETYKYQEVQYLSSLQMKDYVDFDKNNDLTLISAKNTPSGKNIYLIGDRSRRILFENKEKDSTIERYVFFDINEEGNFLFMSPDQYYLGSENLKDLVFFKQGDEYFEFEQFDLKYNRPDIILDRLGYADSSLVDAYHQAYLKRLKKMGFTEDMLKDDFHLPELKIENFEQMPTIHDQGSIDIKLDIKDSKYKLDRINVWVNDVAIYGINGISLRGKNIQEYVTTLSVELVKGRNKIQVSVLNQAGAESYKETFEIECTIGKDKPDLYLITIGESEFKQSDYNLTYASKDANDMADLFGKSKAYNEVFSKTLINEQVTKENVLALRSFLEQADINDQVMIFIAGHGVLDANLDYYFATYDMDFTNPSDKGLAYDDLEGLLDGIKPLKKTLIIDACHSGEIDKDDVDLIAATDTQEEGDIQFRAVGNSAAPKLGMQNTSELTKLLFTDLRKGTGATVISSAGGMEFAMESADWNNGLFTYCLLKGITSGEADLNQDGEIWLSELQEYVQTQVTLLSNGKQQPTSRIENQVVDFRVW